MQHLKKKTPRTLGGSPDDAVSYVSVVLDACELSPSTNWFKSMVSLESSFTIGSSNVVFINCESIKFVFTSMLTNDVSTSPFVESIALLSASGMLAINGVGTESVLTGFDGAWIDLRPDIGSKRSRIESRGLTCWPDVPFDSRKSKSVGFKITEKHQKYIENLDINKMTGITVVSVFRATYRDYAARHFNGVVPKIVYMGNECICTMFKWCI